MKPFLRVISAITIICFTLTNTCLAWDKDSFKLSTPSSFSNLKDPDFRNIAQIQMGIRTALKDLQGFTIEGITALGKREFTEKSVFGKPIKGTVHFDETTQCNINIRDKQVYIENGGFIFKATTASGEVYYCLISEKKGGAGYDISVIFDTVLVDALKSGIVKFTHASIAKEDREIIDRYIEHEISTDNNVAIDEWIEGKMRSGKYAVDNKTAGTPFYQHLEQKVYSRNNYNNIIGNISKLLKVVGVKNDNAINIEANILSIPLVFIPYKSENELPVINIGGEKVRVKAHSSQFATYIFLPEELYAKIVEAGEWDEALKKEVENRLIHEIGARCGLKVAVKNGNVLNRLDSVIESYESAMVNKKPFTAPSEIADLKIVDLLNLELRNDYAAGDTNRAKITRGIFNRIMAVVLAATSLVATAGIKRPTIAIARDAAVTASPTSVSSKYEIAQNFTVQGVMEDAKQRNAFIEALLGVEAAFFQKNRINGIVMDGYNINPETFGLDNIRDWTAPSKESLDIAVLLKIVAGDKYGIILTGCDIPKTTLQMAVSILKQKIDSYEQFKPSNPVFGRFLIPTGCDIPETARQMAVSILKQKIDSYEQFNRSYPVFGGFLPWITMQNGKIHPATDWSDRLPALDNGEWAWSIYAAYHALESAGEKDLAARYKKYFDMLAKNAPIIFYNTGSGKISAVVQIGNTKTRSVVASNYSSNGYLSDFCEGMMMVSFMEVFTDLSQSEKDKIWRWIASNMTRITTPYGTIYQGWPGLDKDVSGLGAPHIKWAWLFLPINNVLKAKILDRVQEEMRSNINDFGLPASTNTPGIIGYIDYDPNIFAPYGAFPMILVQSDVGVAWLLNMLQAEDIEGPDGFLDALSVVPGTNQIYQLALVKTADNSDTLYLALMGGLAKEMEAYLKADGKLNVFILPWQKILDTVFGIGNSVVDKNTGFKLPKGPIIGTYEPEPPVQTNNQVDLSTLWQLPWGDQTTVRTEGNKVTIDKTGDGEWGWAGGSLGTPLTPIKGSAIYFKGKGSFTLKLEFADKSSVTIPVVLTGEDKWTKVPLDSVVGKAIFVIVIDNVKVTVVITSRIYSPDGTPPDTNASTTTTPALKQTANKVDLSAYWQSPALVPMLGNRNTAVHIDDGKIMIKYKTNITGEWGTADISLKNPITLSKGSAIYLKGKGSFALVLGDAGGYPMDGYREVVLKEDTWTMLPVKVGGACSIFALDEVSEDTIITDAIYSPDGTPPDTNASLESNSMTTAAMAVPASPIAAAKALLVGETHGNASSEAIDVLWAAASGAIPRRLAYKKLAKAAPNVAVTPAGIKVVHTAWLKAAAKIYTAMASLNIIKTGGRQRRLSDGKDISDEDIKSIPAKIKEFGVEIFAPKSQFPGNSLCQCKRILESSGGKLITYQYIEDLKERITNPGKSIIMTVDATKEELQFLLELRDLKKKEKNEYLRSMNFAKMENLDKMNPEEVGNYEAAFLSILLEARIITPEDLQDKGSPTYRMLSLLLKDYMPENVPVENYIQDIVTDEARLINTILKALPKTTYKVMRHSVEVLWSA